MSLLEALIIALLGTGSSPPPADCQEAAQRKPCTEASAPVSEDRRKRDQQKLGISNGF